MSDMAGRVAVRETARWAGRGARRPGADDEHPGADADADVDADVDIDAKVYHQKARMPEDAEQVVNMQHGAADHDGAAAAMGNGIRAAHSGGGDRSEDEEDEDQDEAQATPLTTTIDTGEAAVGMSGMDVHEPTASMLESSAGGQAAGPDPDSFGSAGGDREQQEQRQQLLFGSSGAHASGRRGVKSKMMKGITRLVGGLKKR